MNLRFAVASLVALTFAAMAPPAYADDSVDQAIEELDSSSVYVEPGTPGTDDQTEATLASKLQPNDGIILVMIPQSDEPIRQIAQELDDATGNDSIIGLAVGDEVIGFSSALPEGKAADLMRRADNVSTNPVEALGTFTRTMHTYQVQNPEVFDPPEPPGSKADDSIVMPTIAFIIVLVIGIIIAAIAIRRRLYGTNQQYDTVRFNQTPDSVRRKMNDILDYREQVQEPAIVTSLTNIGKYTEAYFRNARQQDNGEYKGTKAILRYLPELDSVVARYIKIQNEPQFNRSASTRLAEYSRAIQALEQFMLEQVRSANADDEFDSRKAADILSASALRTIRHEEED